MQMELSLRFMHMSLYCVKVSLKLRADATLTPIYAWTTYYKTVIENTTDYEITNLEIDVDFLDASGVVIAQTSDYLQNIQPGAKVQSKLMYSNNDGKFETMQYKVTAYTE